MHIIERADKTQNAAGSGGNARINSLSRRSRLPSSGLGSPRHSHVDLGFWAAFIVLHSLLFLPVVLMDREDGTVLPTIHLASQSLDQVWRQLFVWRREPDLLRFNSEIVLFVALWTIWPSLRKRWIRYSFVLVYVLFFLYYLYEGVTFTFFSVEPVFYTQLRMATEGFSFFLENARVGTAFVAGTVLLIVGGAALVARLARYVLPDSGPGPISRAVLGLLAAIVVIQLVFLPDRTSRPEMVFSSIVAKLGRNISESQRVYDIVKRSDSANVRLVYDYSRYSLAQHPPIYIIFSESYGTVLYKRTDWWFRVQGANAAIGQETDWTQAGMSLRPAAWRPRGGAVPGCHTQARSSVCASVRTLNTMTCWTDINLRSTRIWAGF